MKFLEIFGYRTPENNYPPIYEFDKLLTHTKEFKKEWCKTFLVKIPDIIRIQQFTAEGNTYYLVIVANQSRQGNLGKENNELCLIIEDGEYVQIKEFLNQ